MNNSPNCTANLVTSEAILHAPVEQRVHGLGQKCFITVKGTKKPWGNPRGKSPRALFPLPTRWQKVPTQAPTPEHPPARQVGARLGRAKPHLGPSCLIHQKLSNLGLFWHTRSHELLLHPKRCEKLKKLSALVPCRRGGGDRITSRSWTCCLARLRSSELAPQLKYLCLGSSQRQKGPSINLFSVRWS